MPSRTAAPATVPVRAVAREVEGRLIAPLPEESSAALPSRGQVAVTAAVDGTLRTLVVEPDGRKGHWLELGAGPLAALGLGAGDTLELELTTGADWPEPEVPADLAAALEGAEDVQDTWADITPMARWEWVRWVGATRSEDTRARRVEVSLDKMRHGKRRPCCFDLASCTDPELARSGKLIDPS